MESIVEIKSVCEPDENSALTESNLLQTHKINIREPIK